MLANGHLGNRQKKVLLGAFGTRGDVQPMVALARVLVQRGHEATLCVPPNFVPWAQSLGLDARPVGMDFEKFIADHGENVFGAVSTIKREVMCQVEAMLPLGESADVTLCTGVCVASAVLGEKYRKPARFVLFSPSLVPSSDYPSPLTPWQNLSPALNRLSWKVEKLVWDTVFLKTLNSLRRRSGLAPVQDVWSGMFGAGCLLASDSLLGVAPTEPSWVKEQTGPWFFDDPQEVPTEVEEFLASGSAPVFIGFGSMTDSRRDETMKRLLEAIDIAGVRAIIARGWAGLDSPDPPAGVLLVGPTPHAKIFGRCAAVVHHGGAGTLHQAMRAGVPQIVMPHLLDQFFWAGRLARAGLSPGSLARADFDSDQLAVDLRRCIEDKQLRDRCRDAAARMTLDGLDRMVSWLERT